MLPSDRAVNRDEEVKVGDFECNRDISLLKGVGYILKLEMEVSATGSTTDHSAMPASHSNVRPWLAVNTFRQDHAQNPRI